MEVCARRKIGIVTSVTGNLGFIWSPHVDDVVFIPPSLLVPALKTGNWVEFSAEYYEDKKHDRRIRVTEYEVLAQDCLPVRMRGKELMVQTTVAFTADCKSHGDLVVGWSPDFLQVIGLRSMLSSLQPDVLYTIWVAKIKAEFDIEWRVDTSSPPSRANDQTPLSRAPWNIDGPLHQSVMERPPSDPAETSSNYQVFKNVDGVVTSTVAERNLAFVWSPELGGVIVPQICSSGLQLGDWIAFTAEPARSARPQKCSYSAVSCHKTGKSLLPTEVMGRHLLLQTKIRLPSSMVTNALIAKSREMGYVLVQKGDVSKYQPNQTLIAWVKKIALTEECEWALYRVEGVDNSVSDFVPSPINNRTVSSHSNCQMAGAVGVAADYRIDDADDLPSCSSRQELPMEMKKRNIDSAIGVVSRMVEAVGFIWSLETGGCIVDKSLVRPSDVPIGSWVRFSAVPFDDPQGECGYRVTHYELIRPQLPTRVSYGFLNIKTTLIFDALESTGSNVVGFSRELGKIREESGLFQRKGWTFGVAYEAWVLKKKQDNNVYWVLSEMVGPARTKTATVERDADEASSTQSRPISAAAASSPVEECGASRTSTQTSNSQATSKCEARQLLQRVFANETLRNHVLNKDMALLTDLCQFLASDAC